jgi:hypothetical protein
MLTTVSVLAIASVGAAIVTGARVFGLRRMAKHSTATDVVFTGGVAFVLAGTLAGMATAIVAGLIMALFLTALKSLYRLTDRVSETYTNLCQPAPASADSDWEYNTGVHAPSTWGASV